MNLNLDLKFLNNNSLTIVINDSKDHQFIDNKQNPIVNIGYNKLNDSGKNDLNNLVKEQIESGGAVYENETYKRLLDLYNYEKNSDDDKQLLKFYDGIIPVQDLKILKASLYLRNKFYARDHTPEDHEKIASLKQSIIKNYGSRGSNISNLCTAGYYHFFLKELYQEYGAEHKKEYLTIYEEVVNNCLFALFVNKNMGENEIKTNIIKKIESSKKYGLKFVHIHGIGDKNIINIKNTLKKNEAELKYSYKETIKKGNIIIIEIIL